MVRSISGAVVIGVITAGFVTIHLFKLQGLVGLITLGFSCFLGVISGNATANLVQGATQLPPIDKGVVGPALGLIFRALLPLSVVLFLLSKTTTGFGEDMLSLLNDISPLPNDTSPLPGLLILSAWAFLLWAAALFILAGRMGRSGLFWLVFLYFFPIVGALWAYVFFWKRVSLNLRST